jgi:hypothetical protein
MNRKDSLDSMFIFHVDAIQKEVSNDWVFFFPNTPLEHLLRISEMVHSRIKCMFSCALKTT